MLNIALTGLEAAINQYLRLDPDTQTRLGQLQDRVIKLDIIDWNINFYILPNKEGLRLTSNYHEEPDTIIQAKLMNLLKVSCAGANSESLFNNQIDISGDVSLGEKMRDVLQKIDIDWEEHLSHWTGDSIAHKTLHRLNQVAKFAKQTRQKLKRNVSEYLHEEAKCLPNQKQAETFYQAVQTLRDDVDRAQARIQHLKSKRSK